MNSEQTRQEIIDEILESAMYDAFSILEAEFHTQKDRLIQDFIHSFQQMCVKIKQLQERGGKAPIAYIHYSLLRTSILQQKYTYLIEAYSEEWYGDENECFSWYDASWFYKSFAPLQSLLAQKLKKYFRLFQPDDRERIMLKYIPYYHQFVVAIARLAICQAMELPEAKHIAKSEIFRIRIGEFKDISEDIYVSDSQAKTLQYVRKLQRQDIQLAYEDLTELSLQGQSLDHTEMRYADFRGGQLTNCKLRGCILIGTRWNGAILSQSDFSQSLITDADFSQCDLRETSFRHANGKGFREGLYRSPGLQGIRFTDANLEGADFRGAELFCADFQGANLRGAIFSESDVNKYQLSEEQLQSIDTVL